MMTHTVSEVDLLRIGRIGAVCYYQLMVVAGCFN